MKNNDKNVYVDTHSSMIYIHDYIDDAVSLLINRSIDQLSNQVDPLYVYLNTPGGYVNSAISILSSLKQISTEGKEVITIANGVAYSAGAVLFLAGNKRIMTPYSQLMFHLPLVSLSGGIDYIKNDEVAIRELYNRIMKDLLKQTKLPFSEYLSKVSSDNEWFVNPQEAKKYNIATHISFTT